MANLYKKIIGVTLGIKFNRTFRIPDVAGSIIDNIVSGDDTPFGSSFFPRIQENTNGERTLYNKDTSEYLRINTDDFILGVEVINNFEERFGWLKNDVMKFFYKLFHEYKIKNIRRIGIVFSHKLDNNKKLDDAVSRLTENKVSDVDSVVISFSKKVPTTEAQYKKNVNDYGNRIYNLRQVKEATLADLDYQYYFEPPQEDLRECSIEKIFDDAKNYLEKKFYIWLSEYENKKNN